MHHKKIIEGTIDASNVTFFQGTCFIDKSKSASLINEDEFPPDIQLKDEPCILYVLPQKKGLISG